MKKALSQKGFSLIELLLVLVVLIVLVAIASISLSSPQKYAVDDQAKRLSDMLDEARQKALNQRTTFRVEINKTKNKITLIDENPKVDDSSDDVIIRSQPLNTNVVVGAKPSNVTTGPTTTSPIPAPAYSSSTYPLSNGDQKITLRFKRTGEVVDAGTDTAGSGSGSIVSGATIYVNSITPSATNPEQIRAVTVLGTSGDTAIYKCKFVLGVCGNWSK
jgi:prepilin-type N-terminal cleavage/methylation domain-containing protein